MNELELELELEFRLKDNALVFVRIYFSYIDDQYVSDRWYASFDEDQEIRSLKESHVYYNEIQEKIDSALAHYEPYDLSEEHK